MASAAPPLLTAFVYYMVRDLIPPRYVDSILNHIRANPHVSLDPDLKGYAERAARQLAYDPTEDSA